MDCRQNESQVWVAQVDPSAELPRSAPTFRYIAGIYYPWCTPHVCQRPGCRVLAQTSRNVGDGRGDRGGCTTWTSEGASIVSCILSSQRLFAPRPQEIGVPHTSAAGVDNPGAAEKSVPSLHVFIVSLAFCAPHAPPFRDFIEWLGTSWLPLPSIRPYQRGSDTTLCIMKALTAAVCLLVAIVAYRTYHLNATDTMVVPMYEEISKARDIVANATNDRVANGALAATVHGVLGRRRRTFIVGTAAAALLNPITALGNLLLSVAVMRMSSL